MEKMAKGLHWDSGGGLENGGEGPSHKGWRSRRSAEWRACYKMMISLTTLWVVWHYTVLAFARPAELPAARQVAGVPQYVLDYAPLVWLHKGEAYFPSDISAQVTNTAPYINHISIASPPSPLELINLDALNTYGQNGTNVHLTSKIDVTKGPKWLNGVVPDTKGKTNNATSAAIIITDHGKGLVDAFYMYFYAFNRGNIVLFHELGDHIGDWEHNMVRFENGTPQAIWYSQHANGQAFTYNVVEKRGIRPISYSADGSHANYATAGTHDHTIPDINLPAGPLQDYTSKGTLWDPTLSAYFYNFHANTSTFEGLNRSPEAAMNFRGRWGDEQYPQGDKRQPPPFFGFWKYVSGPTGPATKQLNRSKICPAGGPLCIVRVVLGP